MTWSSVGGQYAGGKGYHPEGPCQAWQVGLCEPHEVQYSQTQGAAPSLGSTSTGWAENGWRKSLEEDTGLQVLAEEEHNTTWQRALSAQKAKHALAASEAVWVAGQGRWFCPFTPLWRSADLCLALGSATQERNGPSGEDPEEVTNTIQWPRHSPTQPERTEVFSVKRRLQMPQLSLSVLRRGS